MYYGEPMNAYEATRYVIARMKPHPETLYRIPDSMFIKFLRELLEDKLTDQGAFQLTYQFHYTLDLLRPHFRDEDWATFLLRVRGYSFKDIGETLRVDHYTARVRYNKVFRQMRWHGRSFIFLLLIKENQCESCEYILVPDPKPTPPPEPKKIDLDSTVDELTLSVRAYNLLKWADIRSIRELLRHSESDLLTKPKFGKVSLEDIKQELARHGFSLKVE
jgi:hypothetical protein